MVLYENESFNVIALCITIYAFCFFQKGIRSPLNLSVFKDFLFVSQKFFSFTCMPFYNFFIKTKFAPIQWNWFKPFSYFCDPLRTSKLKEETVIFPNVKNEENSDFGNR